MAKGTFIGLGRKLALKDIRVPTYLLAGQSDDITTKEQVFNAEKLIGTPSSAVVKKLAPGGHIGLFMGRRTLAEIWRDRPMDQGAVSGREILSGRAFSGARSGTNADRELGPAGGSDCCGGKLMTAKNFSLLAAVIFAIVAVLQFARAISGWPITLGTTISIPVWASWVACVVAAVLAWLGFNASRA